MKDHFDIICGASLYWETNLWQRPHQIMSRLAKNRCVLYVRPLDWSIYRQDPQKWPREKRFSDPIKNVHLYSPLIFPYGRNVEGIRRLNNRLMTMRVQRECRKRGFKKKVLWLYSPFGGYLVDKLEESVVVYDCMDDHGAFCNADPALRKKEEWLLEKADLVFTGGRTLYETRKQKSRNCYLFPSAVDSHHFSRALNDDTEIPEDLNNIPGPAIGYFGAVDERLDYKLIDELAQRNKNYSFVLVGPILKIPKEKLPHRKNIFFLDAREYATLPAYIKGFQAGFMPFAMTPLTKTISPTKTLEYLAAGCRIVSTPVPDVVSDYSGLVRIGSNATEISNGLKEIIDSQEPERIRKGMETAADKSWDKTVGEMERLVLEKMQEKDF